MDGSAVRLSLLPSGQDEVAWRQRNCILGRMLANVAACARGEQVRNREDFLWVIAYQRAGTRIFTLFPHLATNNLAVAAEVSRLLDEAEQFLAYPGQETHGDALATGRIEQFDALLDAFLPWLADRKLPYVTRGTFPSRAGLKRRLNASHLGRLAVSGFRLAGMHGDLGLPLQRFADQRDVCRSLLEASLLEAPKLRNAGKSSAERRWAAAEFLAQAIGEELTDGLAVAYARSDTGMWKREHAWILLLERISGLLLGQARLPENGADPKFLRVMKEWVQRGDMPFASLADVPED